MIDAFCSAERPLAGPREHPGMTGRLWIKAQRSRTTAAVSTQSIMKTHGLVAAGCVLGGFVLVAVVGPGFGEGGVVGCEVVEEVGAGCGVVNAGGGEEDGQEEAAAQEATAKAPLDAVNARRSRRWTSPPMLSTSSALTSPTYTNAAPTTSSRSGTASAVRPADSVSCPGTSSS